MTFSSSKYSKIIRIQQRRIITESWAESYEIWRSSKLVAEEWELKTNIG